MTYLNIHTKCYVFIFLLGLIKDPPSSVSPDRLAGRLSVRITATDRHTHYQLIESNHRKLIPFQHSTFKTDHQSQARKSGRSSVKSTVTSSTEFAGDVQHILELRKDRKYLQEVLSQIGECLTSPDVSTWQHAYPCVM